MIDIFKFWERMELKKRRRTYVHPADAEILKSVNHDFDLRCLPSPIAGPLRTAPVVLLYLAPGLRQADVKYARSREYRRYFSRRLRGQQQLPGTKDPFPRSAWFEQRTRRFGPFGKVRKKVAFLNIGAYHSRTFNDVPLLAALPSSRVSLDWAQQVLFAEAKAGKRVVICLRAARFWGLREGKRYGRKLFAPPVTRSGHMKKGAMRCEVIRAVQAAISG